MPALSPASASTTPVASTRPASLELTDVHHRVSTRGQTVEILRGVDLTARAGAVTALLGPNGAGKTTTLTIAQGLIRPTSGQVRLLGQEPWRAGAGLRSRVGVMLQEGGLPQAVTPRRLLSHVCSLYRQPVDMPTLVTRLEIDAFADRDIRRLSGGQKQRVALAAALAGRPDIVFLDEPSAGLDPVSRHLVFDLVRDLKRAGVAIVLTTHLLDDAQRLADQVVLLRQGQVERRGTVAELTSHDAAAPLVFCLATPLREDQLATSPAGLTIQPRPSDAASPSETIGPAGHGYLVQGADTPQKLAALAHWWAELGVMPTDLHLARRSLEDVFLEVAP